MDHQGHGCSEGDRLYVKSIDDYVDDVGMMLKKARIEHPNKPIFLFGHSMGGLISIHTTLKYQPLIAAAVYSAPPLYLDPSEYSPFLVATLRYISSIFPKIRVQGLDISTLCTDKSVVDRYVNDPLVCKEFPTVSLQYSIVTSIEKANRRLAEIELPALILQGSEDRLVSPKGTSNMYKNISSVDKLLKVYENGYHEILNENEKAREDVVKYLTRFIQDQ